MSLNIDNFDPNVFQADLGRSLSAPGPTQISFRLSWAKGDLVIEVDIMTWNEKNSPLIFDSCFCTVFKSFSKGG